MKKIFSYSPIFILIIFILFSLSIQCYTSFQHPKVLVEADSAGYYYEEEITFADDCSSCHEQNTQYSENYSDIYDDPIYDESYNWNYYFVTPWWYDAYYYEAQPVPSADDLAPTQRRDFDRRESSDGTRYAAPSPSRPSLAKPKSESSSSSNSTPPRRHERRNKITNTPNKSKQSATPAPNRVSKKESKSKKKKK